MTGAASEAHRRVAAAAAARLLALRRALSRSPLAADAAELLGRLAALEREPVELGSRYLRLLRELAALAAELRHAEAARHAEERRARAAAEEVVALIGGLRQELVPPLRRLLPELPPDRGMGERLAALRALLHARLELVPRLAAARSLRREPTRS